jgi:pyruvate kinase
MFAGVDLAGKVLPLHLISLGVEASLEYLKPAAVFMCADDEGRSARRLASFRLPVWIAAVSSEAPTCQNLLFSYGVVPVHKPEPLRFWNQFARDWVRRNDLPGDFAILTQQPNAKEPDSNHRMEIIDL